MRGRSPLPLVYRMTRCPVGTSIFLPYHLRAGSPQCEQKYLTIVFILKNLLVSAVLLLFECRAALPCLVNTLFPRLIPMLIPVRSSLPSIITKLCV